MNISFLKLISSTHHRMVWLRSFMQKRSMWISFHVDWSLSLTQNAICKYSSIYHIFKLASLLVHSFSLFAIPVSSHCLNSDLRTTKIWNLTLITTLTYVSVWSNLTCGARIPSWDTVIIMKWMDNWICPHVWNYKITTRKLDVSTHNIEHIYTIWIFF